MEVLSGLCEQDPATLRATAWRKVCLDDDAAVARAVAWWENLTGSGGEGIVVKPASFAAHGLNG